MDPKLRSTVAQINKAFGAGAVLFGNEIALDQSGRLPSGSLSVDVALGGGWTIGQWHEIRGYQSSGKTTLLLKTIAACQKMDEDFTTWWSASEMFNRSYAELLGVDTSRVIVHDNNVLEDALEAVLEVAKAQVVDCVVIDSYPAMVPRKEEQGESGDSLPGQGARLLNQFFRMQGSATRRSLVDASERPITCFLVNQWREKITMFGDPRTTPGGKGKDFACVTQTEVVRVEMIYDAYDPESDKKSGNPVGQTMSLYTLKNKTAPPHRRAEVDFYFKDYDQHFAGSFDAIKEIVAVGITLKLIKSESGSWFSFEGVRMNGRKGVREAMADDPDLSDRLVNSVMALVRPAVPLEVNSSKPKKAPPKAAKAAGAKKLAKPVAQTP
jgi:recombination protein RecA